MGTWQSRWPGCCGAWVVADAPVRYATAPTPSGTSIRSRGTTSRRSRRVRLAVRGRPCPRPCSAGLRGCTLECSKCLTAIDVSEGSLPGGGSISPVTDGEQRHRVVLTPGPHCHGDLGRTSCDARPQRSELGKPAGRMERLLTVRTDGRG